MAYTKWNDLPHKNSPAERARIKRDAINEIERMGYAAVRKARELTQVELAEKLGISQASVAGIERRTDLQMSTLAKYIRALGGELEIRAVFPEATFHLEPMPVVETRAAKIRTRAPKRVLARAS
jgi:DNA-binding XRE family transcriptional regulator